MVGTVSLNLQFVTYDGFPKGYLFLTFILYGVVMGVLRGTWGLLLNLVTHVIIVSALGPNPLFSPFFSDLVALGLGLWTRA